MSEGRRYLDIAPQFIVNWFKGQERHYVVAQHGLPADCDVVNVSQAPDSRNIRLTLVSREWMELPLYMMTLPAPVVESEEGMEVTAAGSH